MADQVVPDYDQDRLDYEMVSPAQILPDGDSGHADVSLPHAAGHVGHTIHEPEGEFISLVRQFCCLVFIVCVFFFF